MTFRDDGNPGPVVAEAGEPDIPVLARHHRLMFEEIWEKRGNTSPEGCMQAMEEQYKQKLRDGFRDGSCHAWVVRKDSRIVASGALSVVPYVPVPYDPGFYIAFVHSIYTEKGGAAPEICRPGDKNNITILPGTGDLPGLPVCKRGRPAHIREQRVYTGRECDACRAKIAGEWKSFFFLLAFPATFTAEKSIGFTR